LSIDETAGPATLVHVRPETLAVEPETLVLAVGAKPGEAFEPKSWEGFQIAFAEAYVRGEEEARALLSEMLIRDPEAWQPRLQRCARPGTTTSGQTCANTSDQPCALTLALSHSLHRV
jgi:hypothetical protein